MCIRDSPNSDNNNINVSMTYQEKDKSLFMLRREMISSPGSLMVSLRENGLLLHIPFESLELHRFALTLPTSHHFQTEGKMFDYVFHS